MRGQVHWVQQAEAWKHPAIYYRRVFKVNSGQTRLGNGPFGQGRHGRDRRREYKYAQWPRHKRCKGLTIAIWSRGPPGHFRSLPAAGCWASLQQS